MLNGVKGQHMLTCINGDVHCEGRMVQEQQAEERTHVLARVQAHIRVGWVLKRAVR